MIDVWLEAAEADGFMGSPLYTVPSSCVFVLWRGRGQKVRGAGVKKLPSMISARNHLFSKIR